MKYAPYSFSKINTFFDCPKKFEFAYITKVEIDYGYSDPYYFIRGRFLHSYIANRLSGGNGMISNFNDVSVDDKLHLTEMAEKTLENEYINLSFDFDHNLVEAKMYLNHKMSESESKSNAAFVGYIDYCAVQDDFAMIIDWKTGKYRDTPSYDQLELYAIWLLDKYPNIQEFDLLFYYVEHDKFSIKTVGRVEVENFKTSLKKKISLIENTESFKPNINKHCEVCAYFNTCNSNE